MKEAATLNKKKFSGHRIIGALFKGVLWGWVLSFCFSIFYWQLSGFEVANNRLVSMMKTEKHIESAYSDTKIFAFVGSVSSLIVSAAKSVTQSREVSVANRQLQSAMGSKGNSYLAPAEYKAARLWCFIQQGVMDMLVLAKNNSLMVLGKLLLFVLGLPLLGLSWLFGVVDGFAMREIRTAELGRESSFIFHRFLGFVPVILWVLIAVYLVIPIWINPVVFFMGASLVTLLLASRTVSKFKKYV